MSYSFSVQASTKDAAVEQVRAKMAEVVSQQQIHQHDQAPAVTNASNAISLLSEDTAADISVSVSGYLSWTDLDHKIRQVNISATASVVDRKPS